MSTVSTEQPIKATMMRGGVAGMVAGAAMAMFAMIASATYQHHGFFTPLFHISALLGSPDAMMRSMNEAMTGSTFWFTGGPALLGMMIHMVTGAVFGVGFALIVARAPRRALVQTGAMYGLLVFAMSAFVGLPLAARITDTGDVIADMATMVGRGTFAVEHMMYGVVLGLLAARSARPTGDAATSSDRRSAMLVR